MNNNSDIFYTKIGHGKPVVLLHGFAQSHYTWNYFSKLSEDHGLLENYALYYIDLIGHGKSIKPNIQIAYSMQNMVDSLHSLIKKLNLQNYILLGYSLGGRVAMHYTLKYAAEVRALILESSSFGIADQQQRAVRKKQDENLAYEIETKGIAFFEQYWSNLPLFASQKLLPPSEQENIKNSRLCNCPQALAHTLRMTGQGSLEYVRDDFFNLNIPTLYICGELDEKYMVLAKSLLNDANKHLQVNIIENAGHNTHAEQSHVFFDLVKKFILTLDQHY